MIHEVQITRKKVTIEFNNERKTWNNLLNPATNFQGKYFIKSVEEELTSKELSNFFITLLETDKIVLSSKIETNLYDEKFNLHLFDCKRKNSREKAPSFNILGLFDFPFLKEDHYIIIVVLQKEVEPNLNQLKFNSEFYIDLFSITILASRDGYIDLTSRDEKHLTSKYSFIRKYAEAVVSEEKKDEDCIDQSDDSSKHR